jgi:hypothetical protein
MLANTPGSESVHTKRRSAFILFLWEFLAFFVLSYFVLPGFIMGIMAKIICSDVDMPTLREKRIITYPFYPAIFVAHHVAPIGDLYDWEVRCIIGK